MNILFCNGTSILSKAICWLSGESVDHVALEFPDLGIVVHSNLLGVNIQWTSYFLETHTIVYELQDGRQDPTADKELLDHLMNKYEGDMYDYGAFVFLGITLAIRKFLHIPLPHVNLWRWSGTFLCTEWVELVIGDSTAPALTPYGLYEKLYATGKWLNNSNPQQQ